MILNLYLWVFSKGLKNEFETAVINGIISVGATDGILYYNNRSLIKGIMLPRLCL